MKETRYFIEYINLKGEKKYIPVKGKIEKSICFRSIYSDKLARNINVIVIGDRAIKCLAYKSVVKEVEVQNA